VRALDGFTATLALESGDKLTRFGPFSSQCRGGNLKIRRGSWNEELFRVLEGFPEFAHDDEVDACSGALEMLSPDMRNWGLHEHIRRELEKLKPTVNPAPPKPYTPAAQWNGRPSRRRKERLKLRLTRPSEPGRSPLTGTNSSNPLRSSGESCEPSVSRCIGWF